MFIPFPTVFKLIASFYEQVVILKIETKICDVFLVSYFVNKVSFIRPDDIN